MNFELNEEQSAILEAVREFARGELAPKADETDAKGEFPWENVRKLGELDLMGIPVEEKYGGLGADFLTWTVVGEELSAACTTTGAVYGAHMLCVYPIMLFGTEEQKQKYLTPLARGYYLWARPARHEGRPVFRWGVTRNLAELERRLKRMASEEQRGHNA